MHRHALYLVSAIFPMLFGQLACAESEFFPTQRYYPDYRANPKRATFSAQQQAYARTSIPGTSTHRIDTKIGGFLPIWRRSPDGQADKGWLLMLEAGFHAQFDSDHNEDNIGWDGLYGLYFDHRISENTAQRIGLHHTSSHIGDELVARTGLARINYTRNEAVYGISHSINSSSTLVYLEAGYGLDLRNRVLQQPWRFETGAQYQSRVKWKGIFSWYAALDISAYDENNWETNTTLQLGIASHRYNRLWRFGFEFYEGRGQMGEFFLEKERYTGFGLWIDI